MYILCTESYATLIHMLVMLLYTYIVLWLC